ncbi:cysteine peptidase family C39 domain-containing protein [Microvirga sp. G4-2]|uniref:cysteine peptidase family C39 domain-containing protein n=1 Tax=Microvirga sp. G4-2 TaxID=3434467 RepID=UPI004043C008
MKPSLLNFTGGRRLPVIVQAEAAECGLACLAMVASYHGHKTDLNALRRRFPVSLKGVTLRSLIQVAGYLHLACRAVRFELGHLPELRLPAIVHWDLNHFVVLKAVTRKGIIIHDPASGERRYPLEEASKHLSGIAVELTPTETFTGKDERTQLPLRAFWGHIRGMPHVLVQILALSIVLEVLVIASPFYMQVTIDEVIARGDVDLLLILALGFGLLTAITVVSTALRSHIVLILQNTLHFQIGARLFHHLVRLPLSFFEKRHIGDILSRFSSIEPIRNLLAEGVITALIDSLMAVATLVMIFIYSPVAYNTLIGDMGSSLSGGQKQRVLLARALYRQPKILFLDEGTAHLDVENERHINEGLRSLAITRISVAHRPETMAGADQILHIDRTVSLATVPGRKAVTGRSRAPARRKAMPTER